MENFNAVSYFDIEDYESVVNKLIDMDFKIYYIDGKNGSTMQEFYDFVKDTLPVDPPLTGKVNFDAFVDSLGSGLMESEYDKVAIVYKNSEEFIKQDRFDVFVKCMYQISEEILEDQGYGYTSTILRTFLFEKGSKFSRLYD